MLPVRKTIGGLGNIMFKQAYIYAQMRRGEIPDIYVQSEEYWKEFADEIKLMYQVDQVTRDLVSLHIRRGDYKDTDFYVDLTETDYYQKAVEMFPDDKFLVFYKDRQVSELDEKDKAWIKGFLDTIIPGRYTIWEGGTETDDLNAMASCADNIMANSSFSWWAAYLNPNLKKKVVCPANWFTDGIMRIDLQDEWIKL
jgi:hypothetical protein